MASGTTAVTCKLNHARMGYPMSFKTTYILFGILAGMFLLIVLAVWLGPASSGDSTFILPSMHKKETVKTDDIDFVEIDRAKPTKEKLVF